MWAFESFGSAPPAAPVAIRSHTDPRHTNFHDAGRPLHAGRRGGRWVVGGYGMAHPASVDFGDVPPATGTGVARVRKTVNSEERKEKPLPVRAAGSPGYCAAGRCCNDAATLQSALLPQRGCRRSRH